MRPKVFINNTRLAVSGVVLIILLIDFLLSLAVKAFFPLLPDDVLLYLMIGVGMIMLILCSLLVYALVMRQAAEAKLPLVEERQTGGNDVVRSWDQDGKLTLEGPDHKLEEQILLSTVIEQTEDRVLISNNHRTILYINPAFERSSGYSCEELKGHPMRRLRSDQHDNAFFRRMKEILDRGETWMGVIVNRGKDGVDFEIEGTISPIKDASGKISHWVAVGRDMSRFRKLERELQRMQKMDALGTLAGGIAHDFNNILAAVMGLVEMEYLGAQSGSLTQKRMKQALAACGRARDLVRQILAFSSQSVQRRRPLKMSAVIDDAMQMLRATLPTTISMQSEFEAEDALILGDSIQIHQIIVNLCTNAAHAMRNSGGVMGIGLKEVQIDDTNKFEHPELRPGSYVQLLVSDTGEGMDQSVQERMFEPFFSTKGPGEGIGVGLSVVHGIVKSHGGKINVSSEPGKGSLFVIIFPKIEGVEDSAEAERIPASGHETILLVDDEEIVVNVATEMLHVLGYKVVGFQSSGEALEAFRSQPDQFQLIITDQTMPGMTGMEFAREVRKITDIPIVLCSGYSGEDISKKAQSLGIHKILAKPFVLHELASSIRDIIDSKA